MHTSAKTAEVFCQFDASCYWQYSKPNSHPGYHNAILFAVCINQNFLSINREKKFRMFKGEDESFGVNCSAVATTVGVKEGISYFTIPSEEFS